MNTRLSKPTILLLTFGALLLTVAFIGLFFTETRARVISAKSISFHQQGHPGVMYSNFEGSMSVLQIVYFESLLSR